MVDRRPGPDLTREQVAARLRQRLWGATVLIALAVVVLPFLLDGSGSESQFRRVEKLREEPPRIVGSGAVTVTDVESDPAAGADGGAGDGVVVAPAASGRPVPAARPDADAVDRAAGAPAEVGESGVAVRPGTAGRREARELPRAWVVQAGSFRERANALAVLDLLRRDGHAAFVVETDDTAASFYRVLVGPMVDETLAAALRDEVVALLGREAIVVAYP